MKSFKKAVLLTLSLAMLVSVISLPASAVVGTREFTEKRIGYSFDGYLFVNNSYLTATLNGTLIPESVPGAITSMYIKGDGRLISANGVYDSFDVSSVWSGGTSCDAYFEKTGITIHEVILHYAVNGEVLKTLSVMG